MPMLRALLLALVLVLPAGCVSLGASEDAPVHRLDKRVTLEAHKQHETNVRMKKSLSFTLSFNASAEVEWDAHRHGPDGRAEVVASGRGATGGDVVTATVDGVYSILFKNFAGAPVNVSYVVEGQFEPIPGA